MLDSDEVMIPLAKSGRLFDSPTPPHVGTLFRWALKGVGRQRVKLATTVIGGRRYTSRAAVARFVEQLSGASEQGAILSRQRTEQMHLADKDLEAEGF